jgi:hypothetical protein
MRDHLLNISYDINIPLKEYLCDLIKELSLKNKTLKEIYRELANKDISEKYDLFLSDEDLKLLRILSKKIKGVPVPNNKKSNLYETLHIILNGI